MPRPVRKKVVATKSRVAPTGKDGHQTKGQKRLTRKSSDQISSDQHVMTGALPVKSKGQSLIEIGSSSSSLSESSVEEAADVEQATSKQIRTGRSRSKASSQTSTHATRSTEQPTQVINNKKTRTAQTNAGPVTSDTVATPKKPSREASDDLFGLSPSGKVARTEAQISAQQPAHSRRTSFNQPASLLKAFGTPAAESSILALGRFKRRKRQGSIIRQMQDMSGLDTDLENGLDLDLDDSNFGLGNFSPEHESTPVHKAVEKEVRTSSSRKRKFDESEIQVPQSSIASAEPSSDDLPELPQKDDNIIPATQDNDQPQPYSETMAPPLSSSSILSDASSPARQNSSPPPAATKKSRRDRGPEISTLHLQSLLPRTRRAKTTRASARVVYHDEDSTDLTSMEMDTEPLSDSEPEEQEEEEEEQPRTRRSRRKPPPPPAKPSKTKKSKRQPLSTTTKGNKSSTTLEPPKKKSTTGRKYGGRLSIAEKENDFVPEDEETVTFGESTILEDDKREKVLDRVRDKFKQVDEWEMEFETVDFGDESSQGPWR